MTVISRSLLIFLGLLFWLYGLLISLHSCQKLYFVWVFVSHLSVVFSNPKLLQVCRCVLSRNIHSWNHIYKLCPLKLISSVLRVCLYNCFTKNSIVVCLTKGVHPYKDPCAIEALLELPFRALDRTSAELCCVSIHVLWDSTTERVMVEFGMRKYLFFVAKGEISRVNSEILFTLSFYVSPS